MQKSLFVVVDQFSERVLDFDNVTLYDYGHFETVTIFDNLYDIYTGTYSGYGNIDQISVTTPDLVGGFIRFRLIRTRVILWI